MKYRTAAALEMAVKTAAKASPMDTNRAIMGFYLHRFLCRVFHDRNDMFILKGGLSMLARTVVARYTRDIDLLARGGNLQSAIGAISKLSLPSTSAISCTALSLNISTYMLRSKGCSCGSKVSAQEILSFLQWTEVHLRCTARRSSA